MKNVVLMACGAIAFAACGGGDKEEASAPKSGMEASAPVQEVAAKPMASVAAGAEDGGTLIARSDCAVCHKLDVKTVGPSYAMLAERYEATDENIAMLAGKVITGGSGVWGPAPMSPHANLSQEQAEAMVRHMLAAGADQ